MKISKKHILRTLKWPAFIVVVLLIIIWGFVPLAKWFVGQTLDAYNEVSDNYSNDSDEVTYQGIITDTILQPSKVVKGAIDTVVHQQSIRLKPQSKASDNKPKIENVGTFGDGAGLLNAFFSFLAFMAVLLTIYLQSRKDGHDKQNGARVLFEQEFFAMVGMLENIVSHLKFTDNKPVEDTKMINDIVKNLYGGINTGNNSGEILPEPIVVEGREVFRYIYIGREHYNLLQYVSKEKDLRQSAAAQEMCFDGTLDHYFRYLYRILKHIDESKLLDKLDDPDKEREYYAHLLRAQLSNYELKMLFYNGLLGENPDTIKKLIEKYAMFNNLRAWELGKFQAEYYQPILDMEMLDDPKDIDLQTTYRVAAFWDKEKLNELKKEAKKKAKEPWLCVKCYRKMKKGIKQRWDKMRKWREDEQTEKDDVDELTEKPSDTAKIEREKPTENKEKRGPQPWELKVQKIKGKKQNPDNFKSVKKSKKKRKKK